MAKNQDRRKLPKPKPKKGDPPPLRRARPDLKARVRARFVASWPNNRTSAMNLAKMMGEHVEDVLDCLIALKKEKVIMESDGVFSYDFPDRPKQEVKKKLDPATLLKIRRVCEQVGAVTISDFKNVEDISEYLKQLRDRGLLRLVPGHARADEVYTWVDPPGAAPPTQRWKPVYKGNGTCPWCKRPSRRHARAGVHDPVQCRLDMIADIMSN